MKKNLILLLAIVSLAMMGCSDSDSIQSGIMGYEAFLNVRSAWKEPTSYSYTVHGDTYMPDAFVIDVKVTNGLSELSLNPNFPDQARGYGSEESEYRKIENLGWNIKTISGIFESIEKENVYVKTDPSIQMIYNYCLIEINYDKCNGKIFPSHIRCLGKPKKSDLLGGYSTIITITDFKILEE